MKSLLRLIPFLSAVLLTSACGVPPEDGSTNEDEAGDSAVDTYQSELLSCVSSPLGAGAVGSKTNPKLTISALIPESPTVLRVTGFDITNGTSNPPSFNGLVSFGTGFELTGSFGNPSLLAYITNVQISASLNSILISGSQRGTDLIWRPVTSTINLGKGTFASASGFGFDRMTGITLSPNVMAISGATSTFLPSTANFHYDGQCTANASVVGTTGSITLNASAPGAKGVTFYIDGVAVKTDLTAPFSVPYNSVALLNGAHQMWVKATDESNNVAVSPKTTFTTNNATGIIVTASVTGTAGNITLLATAGSPFPVTEVSFFLDGSPVAVGTDPTAPYSMMHDSRLLTNGTHTLVAKAKNTQGIQRASTAFSFTTDNDFTGPTDVAAIVVPFTGGFNFYGTVGVPTDVVKVDFVVDGTVLNTDSAAPYNVSYSTRKFTNGSHQLVVRAYDAGGASADSPIAAFISTSDFDGPVVSDLKASAISGLMALSATATDATGVYKMEFFVDDKPAGYDTAAPWAIGCNTRLLTNGTHTLYVKATDSWLQTTTSATVNFETKNDLDPPTNVNLTVSGTKGFITFTATATDASPLSYVQYYIDGFYKGSDAIAPYAYQYNSLSLTNGVHKVRARVFDSFSQYTDSPEIDFTVSN